MNDLGFVIPLDAEAAPIVKRLKQAKALKFGQRTIKTGVLRGKKISLIVSGCGKIKAASATQLLIDQAPAKLYVHFGTSGALSPKLEIGDVVMANEVVEHDVVELFPEFVPRQYMSFHSLTIQGSLHLPIRSAESSQATKTS